MNVKRCAYCGRENSTNATHCVECGTEVADGATAGPSGERPLREYEFAGLTTEQSQQDFVTLLRCRTLAEADLIVSRLAGSGIKAFIPDEYLMQVICWNLNTYGYVRVQVQPRDYQAAVELLTASRLEGEPGVVPNSAPAMPTSDSGVTQTPPSV